MPICINLNVVVCSDVREILNEPDLVFDGSYKLQQQHDTGNSATLQTIRKYDLEKFWYCMFSFETENATYISTGWLKLSWHAHTFAVLFRNKLLEHCYVFEQQ